jgi:hypothetical protein
MDRGYRDIRRWIARAAGGAALDFFALSEGTWTRADHDTRSVFSTSSSRGGCGGAALASGVPASIAKDSPFLVSV